MNSKILKHFRLKYRNICVRKSTISVSSERQYGIDTFLFPHEFRLRIRISHCVVLFIVFTELSVTCTDTCPHVT